MHNKIFEVFGQGCIFEATYLLRWYIHILLWTAIKSKHMVKNYNFLPNQLLETQQNKMDPVFCQLKLHGLLEETIFYPILVVSGYQDQLQIHFWYQYNELNRFDHCNHRMVCLHSLWNVMLKIMNVFNTESCWQTKKPVNSKCKKFISYVEIKSIFTNF